MKLSPYHWPGLGSMRTTESSEERKEFHFPSRLISHKLFLYIFLEKYEGSLMDWEGLVVVSLIGSLLCFSSGTKMEP